MSKIKNKTTIPNNLVSIRSLEQLKLVCEILTNKIDATGLPLVILSFPNGFDSVSIWLDEKNRLWDVLLREVHHPENGKIDDVVFENLSDDELATKTNIIHAVNTNNLFLDLNEL